MTSAKSDTIVETQNAIKIVQKARDKFDEGRTRSIEFRRKQLKNLGRFLKDNDEKILAAIYQDMKKPAQEATLYEILILRRELDSMLHNLDNWTKPKRPSRPLVNWLDGVVIYNDPYGVVLVIGPWNYPLHLTLLPAIGAIAAGNCVVIKPSELSPAISQFLYDNLPKYLDKDCYPVYIGGVEETTELLKERFDYIFYTGSTRIGHVIYAAANKNLTPVTLELGGKSPAYIDDSVDMEKTVKRILWGKFMNAGQTCIAPDYILCTKKVQEMFIKCCPRILEEFFGKNVIESPDYTRIISERHCLRLIQLLEGLNVVIGGRYELKDRFLEPTIATDVNPNHAIMQEEIFGPVLPIITVDSLEQAITFIRKRDKPLALYIFSAQKHVQDKILNETSSGGVCINDTILHIAVHCLPFGGVGASGLGSYHGKTSFDTFTHKKSILVKDFNGIKEKLFSSRYAPYSQGKTKFIEFALHERRNIPGITYLPHLIMFILGIAITIVVYYLIQVLK